ncbi:MAG TPA: hypothetical protein VJV78_08035 [Polyangiales bacterium]|nr:hypothetical protein [Polyangiales bacterium]
MTATCRGEPISYLRLERYLQGDVQPAERERVAGHLEQCQICRECFEVMRSEQIELAPLPVPLPATRVRRPWAGRVWPQLTAAAALAATVLLVILARGPEPSPPRLPPAHVRVKGGELALQLVREHAGTIAADATRFSAGDRFQVRVSCPPPAVVHWDVLVLQAGEIFFPFTPSSQLQCANGVTLPGAFVLDGREPANVCVILQSDEPLDRAQLARNVAGSLPGMAACSEIRAAD